jgi:eukaryotic-like serine/threonine-protein kinase
VTEDHEKSARREAEERPTQHAPLEDPVSGTLRAAPSVGQRVGKYVVERTIGHGGMGIVVAARHETLDEMVAIKLLHPKAAKDAMQVERFVREARATVRIKSEHVVRVLDAGAVETTGAPYIVMELLEGRDLGFVLSHYGPVPPVTAVDYIIQICDGLGAAHALGIVHRDLKPSNFFLTQRADGSPLVKVLDFGISKAAQSDGSPDPRLTETQAVFGSPTYMSPEQIRSSKNVDARSDVWSLGVALFELLTGKLPFIADNVAGLLASVIADPPFQVTAFVPGIPPELERVVLGCLEKDPSRRVSSAAELAMRLAPFASADGALLATRVERSARGASNPSFPPPGLGSIPPAASSARDTALMAPPFPMAPPSYPSAPAPAVAYGSTGTDLSATGPAAFRANVRRGSGRGIALLGGAVLLIGALGGLVYVVVAGRASRDPASSTSVAAVAPPVAPPASVVAPPEGASSASAPAVTEAPPASAASGGRRGKPLSPGQGHAPSRASAVASAAPPASVLPKLPGPPTPTPSANLDSRF